ncbi:MAG: phage virion morphogenesis protein [Sulfuriferula sp.]
MIEIKVDDARVKAAMEHLAQAAASPRPALLAIGESLVESTKKRFETSTAPDGTRWAPNSQATYLGMVNSFGKGHFNKGGKINARGGTRVAGKKPLIGATRNLSTEINYALDGNGLRVGSPMEYAAMQQFGGKKSQFPNLWGDIPAREFLGVSEDDAQMIVATVSEYLQSVI